MKSETKYIFVQLVIRNGSYTYTSDSVYQIPKEKDMYEFAEQTVKNYHSIGKPFKKNPKEPWWYFFCGEVSVMYDMAMEITKQEYDVLNKFL